MQRAAVIADVATALIRDLVRWGFMRARQLAFGLVSGMTGECL